ncbi:hypothetical protein EJ02DRAFT_200226 [Clathrospora elynae]|uniref:Uncharacterized protein n=1 Tax=Clathrospora elynae TaxID=706981 RepID=A0A6A5T441_9PLEO|nr:hypothetical protein EJ02DRAFT_200226 [Clathrospora elynae]
MEHGMGIGTARHICRGNWWVAIEAREELSNNHPGTYRFMTFRTFVAEPNNTLHIPSELLSRLSTPGSCGLTIYTLPSNRSNPCRLMRRTAEEPRSRNRPCCARADGSIQCFPVYASRGVHMAAWHVAYHVVGFTTLIRRLFNDRREPSYPDDPP